MASTSKGKRERLQQPEPVAGAKRAKTARDDNVGVPPQISPTATYGNRVAWNDAVNRDWLTDVREVVIEEGTSLSWSLRINTSADYGQPFTLNSCVSKGIDS